MRWYSPTDWGGGEIGGILLEGYEYLAGRRSVLNGPNPVFFNTQKAVRVGETRTRMIATLTSSGVSRRVWEQHKPVICA